MLPYGMSDFRDIKLVPLKRSKPKFACGKVYKSVG